MINTHPPKTHDLLSASALNECSVSKCVLSSYALTQLHQSSGRHLINLAAHQLEPRRRCHVD